MKRAQFTPIGSSEKSLGVLVDDLVVAVSALTVAASRPDKQISAWLLEAPDTLSVIGRGDQGLADIAMLIKRAPSSAFEIDGRVALPVDSVRFEPPVYPSKIIAIC